MAWSWNPAILVGLMVYASVYARGWVQLRRRGRGVRIPPWRASCYFGGLATLGLALLSPLATYGDRLFFAHMIEHMFIMDVTPLLVLLGAPLLPVLWAFPKHTRRAFGLHCAPRTPLHRICRVLTTPALALMIYLLVIAAWHLPTLYDAAQGTSVIHGLEHLVFLGAGLLFWWPVVHPTGGRRRLGYEMAPLYLLAAASESGLLGGLFIASSRPLYAAYLQQPRIAGLSPLVDQEIGGLSMMVGDVIYIAGTVVAFIKYINHDERTAEAAVDQARSLH